MKFSSLFASLLCLVPLTAGLAAPTRPQLHRRACSSIQDIQIWINANTDVGAKTIFYTASAKSENAKAFQAENGGHYWGEIFGNKWLEWIEECGEGDAQNELFPRMGQALAKCTTSNAFVLMNKGEKAHDFVREPSHNTSMVSCPWEA
jgi:hypothetical protein